MECLLIYIQESFSKLMRYRPKERMCFERSFTCWHKREIGHCTSDMEGWRWSPGWYG